MMDPKEEIWKIPALEKHTFPKILTLIDNVRELTKSTWPKDKLKYARTWAAPSFTKVPLYRKQQAKQQ